MYQDHPYIERPADDLTIWRYMDVARFIDILIRKELYFCRVDKLEDPFEGVFPQESYEAHSKQLAYCGLDETAIRHLMESMSELRKVHVVTCWHINDEESDAMWKLYSDKGIAIKTTFKGLCDSFANEETSISIGKVQYGYDKFNPPGTGWTFNAILLKRKCFEHEKELRAIIIGAPGAFESGYYVKVDPDILIDQVFISPLAPKWFKETLDRLLEKYELRKDVVLSTILDPPAHI